MGLVDPENRKKNHYGRRIGIGYFVLITLGLLVDWT